MSTFHYVRLSQPELKSPATEAPAHAKINPQYKNPATHNAGQSSQKTSHGVNQVLCFSTRYTRSSRDTCKRYPLTNVLLLYHSCNPGCLLPIHWLISQ